MNAKHTITPYYSLAKGEKKVIHVQLLY